MPDTKIQNTDNIICGCTGTTKEKITQLIQAGTNNIDDIASATGATTGCGGCDSSIVEFIEQHKTT